MIDKYPPLMAMYIQKSCGYAWELMFHLEASSIRDMELRVRRVRGHSHVIILVLLSIGFRMLFAMLTAKISEVEPSVV